MKPSAKPSAKPAEAEEAPASEGPVVAPDESTPKTSAKPAGFRPTMKPKPVEASPDKPAADGSITPEPAKPKPAFRPTMKPAKPVTDESASADSVDEVQPAPLPEEPPKPQPAKAAFRPTMRPKPDPGLPKDEESA